MATIFVDAWYDHESFLCSWIVGIERTNNDHNVLVVTQLNKYILRGFVKVRVDKQFKFTENGPTIIQ